MGDPIIVISYSSHRVIFFHRAWSLTQKITWTFEISTLEVLEVTISLKLLQRNKLKIYHKIFNFNSFKEMTIKENHDLLIYIVQE